MSWRVVVRPEAEMELLEAARWYESQEAGLGDQFVETVLAVWSELGTNPRLFSRRHRQRDIRCAGTGRFPYHIFYEVNDQTQMVIVAALVHSARHERHWRKRFE